MGLQDYLVREIERFAEALALILHRKRLGLPNEAQDTLDDAVETLFGLPMADLRGLAREDFLARCTAAGVGSGERAIAVADLLREDDDPAGRERARWLYEAALASGDAVPLDVYDRIAALRG